MLSLFTNAAARKPEEDISLQQAIEKIQKATPEMKEAIELLRVENDDAEQAKLKRMLPAVTFSGTFEGRSAAGLVKHSGLYVYDLDDVKPVEVKKSLKELPSLVIAFTSPRGNGLKIVLKGPIVRLEGHKAAWETGVKMVEKITQERVDRSGSDVSRLCFLSYDPKLIAGEGKEFGVKSEDDDIMAGVPEPKSNFEEYTRHMAREMLWVVGADLPYNRWRNIIWAVVARFGKEDWVEEMLMEWSNDRGGNKGLKTEEDIKTFHAVFVAKGKGVTFATLIAEAKKAGWVNWWAALARDSDGDIMYHDENLRIVLEYHPDFKGRLWKDSITGIEHLNPIEKPMACTISAKGGQVEQDVAFNVLCDMQSIGLNFRGVSNVLTALVAIARSKERNLRKEWIDTLVWDGVPRLHRMFIDGFGAEDNPCNEALSTAFLTGAVARIFKPGASVQVVPILIGKQGCGKSSGIKALCPHDSWLCDSFVDMESKSGYEVVMDSAIVELSELSTIKKADIEKVKQFVTQSQVKFRSPYDRTSKQHFATWVFIGSTNEEVFLKDTTGNRRFAPVTIENAKVDKVVQWIKEKRDQLWAEAAVIVNKGLKDGKESWAVPRKFWDELAKKAEEAREKDPWEDVLKEYTEKLVHRKGTSMKTLKEIGLEAGVEIANRSEAIHAGRILRRVGWTTKVVRFGEITAVRWIIQSLK